VCLFKRRNRMVYRNALFYGAFRRGCTAIPQTGVGENRKKMFSKPHRKMGLLYWGRMTSGFNTEMCNGISSIA
jgi:hypothetical protein